jgi:hypothetical protein
MVDLQDCSDWTDGSAAGTGMYGNAFTTLGAYFFQAGADACNVPRNVYCLEK